MVMIVKRSQKVSQSRNLPLSINSIRPRYTLDSRLLAFRLLLPFLS